MIVCGDHDDIKKSGVSKVAESQCNMACSGNPNEKCGGDWRLNVYSWIGSPRITKFATASGAAAGEYKFLIGSPIVPLHVTLGINGKVTFLEKSRETTTIKNSTGAYELDLSRISNWNEAWREMSMKTDVFCSAGIVLPDKAGRQLTVGGWSDVAARGVRTYYPDGKPGTRGKNDWDENANQVSLLVNRWYGTAMMMVNGSVLVVGGQVGGKLMTSLIVSGIYTDSSSWWCSQPNPRVVASHGQERPPRLSRLFGEDEPRQSVSIPDTASIWQDLYRLLQRSPCSRREYLCGDEDLAKHAWLD